VILLTVGTQLPFDRFVEVVDRLAPSLPERVFAQVGQASYRPVNMDWRGFVGPIEFEQLIRDCSFIVAHAGIGTVVMAQKHRKPIILFPRRAVLNEHRNDHQLATVRALDGRSGICVALDEDGLRRAVATAPPTPPGPRESLPERDRLRNVVAALISHEQRRRTGE
jgi:UDP-N-acetylglucosamine transferase subunit ALG13